MSRQSSRRGLVALLAVVGGGAVIAAILSSERVRTSVPRGWRTRDRAALPQEPAYVELPDRPDPVVRAIGGDEVDRGIGEGLAIAGSFRHSGTALGLTAGDEAF